MRKPPLTPSQVEEIIDLYLNKKNTVSEISNKFQRSNSCIFKYLKLSNSLNRNTTTIKKTDLEELSRLYNIEKYSIKDLCKHFLCSATTIRFHLIQVNTKFRPMTKCPLNRFQIKEIENLYSTGKYSMKELSIKYNTSNSTIIGILKRNKQKILGNTIWRRKHKVDERFFEVIDTEKKAYFLGLLFADGANAFEKNQIALTLQYKDKDTLEVLNRLIHPERPLLFKDNTKAREKGKNWMDTYTLLIQNKKITEDLTKLGCTPQKSLTLKFPTEEQVPKQLLRHFIRGYFDGDGCITVGKIPSFSIIGNTMFMVELQKIFVKSLDLNINKLHRDIRCKDLVRMSFGGTAQLMKIKSWLYQDATVFLNRKKERFDLISIRKGVKNEDLMKNNTLIYE